MDVCYAPSVLLHIMRMRSFLVYLILLVNPFVLITHQHPYLSNVTDHQALLGFMSAITSQSLRDNWNPNVSFCRWSGITCSVRRQRVVSLNVSSMGLQGTVSPLLGNLSFLRILDIGNNSFHGHIPYQLGNLFRLKKLILVSNQLHGSIPPTLGGCRSLTNMTMAINNLRGNIPSEFCALPNLQFIVLSGNNLTGRIPTCLGNLSSLEWVDFRDNKLHGPVPSELGMLNLAIKIDLYRNSLTGQFPSSFSNLTNLQYLGLEDNQLTGHIPSEFCNKHPPLTGIFLFTNKFFGNIPASLFNCSKLIVIELADNQFSGVVPMEVAKLTQLKGLYLDNNQLVSGSTTSLPILTALTNCSSLKTLTLSTNRLTGRLPSSIGQLSKHMGMIYLGGNQLVGEIPPQIGNLTNLTFLDLDSNFLTGTVPSSFNMLQILERLYLGGNNLQGSIPMEIGQLKSLGLLDLSYNNLSGTIPDSLGSLQQLRYLFLNYNQLLGDIPANIGKCVNLLQIDLSYNRLSGHIPSEVAGLPNLALYFNLSNNLLEGPLPATLNKMIMVQAIDVSANMLSGNISSTLGSCIELKYLNLSYNALEGPIPVSLGRLQNLLDMDLSSNNFTGEIPMSLEKLKMLQHLNFSYNKLSGEVPKDGVFKSLNATAFIGNIRLCGSWVRLPRCFSSKHKSHSHLKRVVIPIAGVTMLVILCLFFGILWRSRRRPAMESLELHPQRLSYEELMRATEEFSDANLLGVGTFGKVYKGVLNDGTRVAVKLFNLENEEANKSFYTECNVLRRVRHRNLIKAITSYSDLHSKALIFPLMENGSLEKWLYPDGNGEQETSGLSLIQRLIIAIDIAQGLAYLHHHCFVQVIHCDLKPSNVLLGDDMTAYLIDFGIATICFASSSISAFTSTHALKGSAGYIPPEYGLGGLVTPKGDVYSYGIVLLEMLTRKKPTHNMFVDGMNLQNWVSSNFPHQIEEVVDKNLLKRTDMNNNEEDKKLNCINQLISVGLLCTRESPSERPNMTNIVNTLQNTLNTLLGIDEDPKFQSDMWTLAANKSTTSNNAYESSSTFEDL